MDFYLLDKDLEFLSTPIDDVTSLEIVTNHNAVGTFSATLSTPYLQDVRAARYVYEADSGYIGRIERIEYNEDDVYGLRIGGESLEGMLFLRVIDEAYAPEETNVEQVVTDAVTKFAATGDRALDRFDVCIQKGYTISEGVSVEPGTPLGEWLYSVLPQYDLRPVVTYNEESKRFEITLYKGVNRSAEQEENEPVIISESFENVQEIEYERDSSRMKNHVYVVMEDSHFGRVVVEVDTAAEGEERREAYLTSAVTSEAKSEYNAESGESKLVPTYTLDECKARMREEGETYLAELRSTETVNGEFVESKSYLYGVDFFVGDTVSFDATGLGVSIDAKITSCTETYEGGRKTIEIRIGEDVSPLAKLKKLVKGA